MWRRILEWLRWLFHDPIPEPLPSPEEEAAADRLLSEDSLARILAKGESASDKDQELASTYAPILNEVMEAYDVSTPLRAAHFLAQVLYESGGLRYTREIWGPTKAQLRYEGRKDLGNTEVGDGYRFRGAGLIQLSGRANFEEYGRKKGIDFVSKPELVAMPIYSSDVAGWYWSTRGLNKWADLDDIKGVTRRVNGGYNGLKARQEYLELAKQELWNSESLNSSYSQ